MQISSLIPVVQAAGRQGNGPLGGAAAQQVPLTTDVLGTVSPPPGVIDYNLKAGGTTTGIGLLLFMSNLIKIATVVAGIYVLFNFIVSGFDYITAGDTKANQKVKDRLTMSVIGLVIIVGSYVVIGVFGLILFGRADYFLNPQICGPGGC